MKSQKLRSINLGSVFKYNLCAGFAIGLIGCAVLLILGYSLRDIGLELGTYRGVLYVGTGIAGALLASVGCGLFAGLAGSVLAFLYNVFAALTGGISVKLDEGA